MNLFVMRHGLALDEGTHGIQSDAERPLSEDGRRKSKLAAAALQKLEITFDAILTSPLTRAAQTAEIVARELGISKALEECPALAPPGNSRGLISRIGKFKPRPENLLIVGHEPHLSQLIATLISENSARVTMKKGAVCKLVVEDLRLGPCASLEWLLTAKQLSFIA